MLEFNTKGFQGYSVKYSPFFDSRIAAATSANFGLVGNGRLYILNLTAEGVVAEKWYDLPLDLPESPISRSNVIQVRYERRIIRYGVE